MDPPAVHEFLRQVERELKDIGPIERRKALAEIRSDIVDLAMDGHPAPPDTKWLDAASRSMPPPREVALAYLASTRPPLTMINVSITVNLLLAIGSIVAGAWLFMSLFVYQGPRILAALFTILLIASGLVGLVSYGLALVRPGSAMRWRFAVLPAMVTALIFDTALSTVAVVGLGWPTLVGVLAPLVVIFGGIYSIAYAHGQLPRLSIGTAQTKRGRDYFRILGWHLRDLDRQRRDAIVTELRNHVAASGIDLEGLPSRERYARIAEVLGRPAEIAAGYVREAPAELSRKQRSLSNLLMTLAVIGIVLGAMVLTWGLSAASFGDTARDMTLLGFVGSAGLLVMSIAVLAGLLHLRRVPMHWPDVAPPIATCALTAALIIAAVFGGLPSGGIVENSMFKSYTVDSVRYGTDGNMDAYWTTWSYEGMQSPLGIPSEARPEGSTITRLDKDRNVVSTEVVPFQGDTGALLAFDRLGVSRVALYTESYAVWEPGRTEFHGLDKLYGWGSVDGRIDAGKLSVSWLVYDVNAGMITVRSTSLMLPYGSNEVTWDRTVGAPRVQTPLYSDSLITQGENRTLATVALTEKNSSSSRSEARCYLFNENGIEISNISLVQVEVSLKGREDRLNGSIVQLDGSRYLAGAFWVLGHSETAVNGTATLRSWAVRIDAADASSRMYELRRHAVPYVRSEWQPPAEEGDPWHYLSQGSEADAGSIFIVSAMAQGRVRTSGGLMLEVASGNVTATRLMADGSQDFAVVLYDLPSGYEWFFIGTLVSMYGGSPSVFVPEFSSFDPGGLLRTRTFTVAQPSHTVLEGEMTVGLTEKLLFYKCLTSLGLFCAGKGVAQGTGEFAAQASFEDRGIFEWRNTARPIVATAPAIIRLDADSGTSTIILLAPLHRLPDTLAGLLSVTLVAVVAVLTLVAGYPRLRSWRIKKGIQGEERTMSKDFT